MYRLARSYGKKTYEKWQKNVDASRIPGSDAKEIRHQSLSKTQTSPKEAWEDPWEVRSFLDLMEKVAFLGSMNKRSVLFFRGQEADLQPLPKLFRSSWSCPFEPDNSFRITVSNRASYWRELLSLGDEVSRFATRWGCHAGEV